MIIVSIINVKVDRRLHVTNKFKYQRRLSSCLAIVMFRGTPCTVVLVTVFGLFKTNLTKLPTLLNCIRLDLINF